jgi:hypothetical protein
VDDCGNDIDCGACAGPNDDCISNACVCDAPTSCASPGKECGTFTDECGDLQDCGGCAAHHDCIGNGCVCVPWITCAPGDECGSVDNGCGGAVSCGSGCTLPDVCNAVNHQCECQPTTTCAAAGRNCGMYDTGCGLVACGDLGGSCPGGAPCTGGVCQGVTWCGDGLCNGAENCATCAGDCLCSRLQVCSPVTLSCCTSLKPAGCDEGGLCDACGIQTGSCGEEIDCGGCLSTTCKFGSCGLITKTE